MKDKYNGFEQGPIRPPSEAYSLLIRITRNCPWNRCTFCPVYKGQTFSLRPKEHVIQDIDLLHQCLERLMDLSGGNGYISQQEVQTLFENNTFDENVLAASLNWFASGMKSVFLQDANSLIISPKDLRDILLHLKYRFPFIERITSYARSHTIAHMKPDDLKSLAQAGLNRIHIGLESGSDIVLKRVKKGVIKANHILAGQMVKQAGISLSEYFMPGLGGRDLSDIHASESADALNQINPDFIRLRTFGITKNIPLWEDCLNGQFDESTDVMKVEEIYRFINALDSITSEIKSDHILNLLEEVEGRLPHDKNKMLNIIKRFLDLPNQSKMIFQIGRRMQLIRTLNDLDDNSMSNQIMGICQQMGISPDNADEAIRNFMRRFI